MSKYARSLCAASLCACLLTLAACKSEMTENIQALPEWEAQPIELPLYRTAPGDVLEVEFARLPAEQAYASDYTLNAGDDISIVFLQQPDGNETTG